MDGGRTRLRRQPRDEPEDAAVQAGRRRRARERCALRDRAERAAHVRRLPLVSASPGREPGRLRGRPGPLRRPQGQDRLLRAPPSRLHPRLRQTRRAGAGPGRALGGAPEAAYAEAPPLRAEAPPGGGSRRRAPEPHRAPHPADDEGDGGIDGGAPRARAHPLLRSVHRRPALVAPGDGGADAALPDGEVRGAEPRHRRLRGGTPEPHGGKRPLSVLSRPPLLPRLRQPREVRGDREEGARDDDRRDHSLVQPPLARSAPARNARRARRAHEDDRRHRGALRHDVRGPQPEVVRNAGAERLGRVRPSGGWHPHGPQNARARPLRAVHLRGHGAPSGRGGRAGRERLHRDDPPRRPAREGRRRRFAHARVHGQPRGRGVGRDGCGGRDRHADPGRTESGDVPGAVVHDAPGDGPDVDAVRRPCGHRRAGGGGGLDAHLPGGHEAGRQPDHLLRRRQRHGAGRHGEHA